MATIARRTDGGVVVYHISFFSAIMEVMYTRIIKWQNKTSFFLFGPRGTGKSTWVSASFPDAFRLDLLKDSMFSELAAHPDRLEAMLGSAFDPRRWIFIDEVQKIPALLDEVHRLIEGRKYRFILTGSSARKLRRQGANLLAGRALTRHLHTLTAEELAGDFDLLKSLTVGHLPAAYLSEDPADFLKSYVATYLREEVQQEALVRNLTGFAKFLEAASFSQGAQLSVQRVATDAGIQRKTAEGYFSLLEDLLLAVRLPVFTRRAKRKLAQHPKFYFFDVGVFRALRPQGPLDLEEEIGGTSLETLVMQEIRATIANHKMEYDLFYWRSHSQVEVDFVLYGKRGLIGIEVKRSSRFRESDLQSLRTFLEDYPMAKAYLFYGGTTAYQFGAIAVLPVATVLPRLGSLI